MGELKSTFYLEPSWLDGIEWARAVHRYLKAFPPTQPCQLWLQVDPARLSLEQAAQLLEPVHAAFGDVPFPELTLSADLSERPSKRIALPSSEAELKGWSCARFGEALGTSASAVTGAPPPAAPAARVEKLIRDKAILDRVRLAQARLKLERSRRERPDLWTGTPLVSVRISTLNRPKLLVERALRSVLRQTYPNFEVVVVGDGAGPETAEAMAQVKDPRVRYFNLPERPRYARFPRFLWSTAGTYAVNTALELCRGEWIAPLDDDDEFTPDHLAILLGAARQAELELVWGQMECFHPRGWTATGSFPLARGQICHGAVLYSAVRLGSLRYDPYAWLEDDPGDWNLWKRTTALDARLGFLPKVLGRHFPEYSAVSSPEERARMFDRKPTAEEICADAEWTGALDSLDLP